MMRKIWVGMSTTTCNIHLSQFKFKVTCKNEDFACRYIRNQTREIHRKFPLLNLPFCIFSHKSTIFWLKTYLDEMHSKWFIITQRIQNLKFATLKYVTYAQPIPLPLSVALSSFIVYTLAGVTHFKKFTFKFS